MALACGVSANAMETTITASSKPFRVPLVELYTSEGCSSCPRADRWLSQLGESLADDFEAVPLAFHVDYWNYLGWTDPFARPEYTERQRTVALNNRQASIYTPELVVDGREARGGRDIVESIQQANVQRADVGIQLTLRNGEPQKVSIDARIDNRSANDRAEAFIAVFENQITREIGAGENRGRTLRYDFVVRHWSRAFAVLNGKQSIMHTVDIPADWGRENLHIALVVLNPDTGATLQAIRTPINALFDY